MNAPIVFMPQCSTSYNVLMVDLGHLAVKNLFEKPGQRSSSGIPAVLEKMNVTLTAVKITRSVLSVVVVTNNNCKIYEFNLNV